MEIKLTKVTSSKIDAIGYSEPDKVLAIRFKSGGLYHYANVTHEEYIAFASAESVGSFFYRNIKNNPQKYPYTKQ